MDNELIKPPINIITPDYADNSLVFNSVGLTDMQGRLSARSKIDQFESAIQEAVGSERGDAEEINDNGLNEYLIGGAYTRSLLIPKDITMVSMLWSKERLWIIATGEVTFTTEMGTQRVKAPYVWQPPFGSKVALHTHEDTLWFAITGAESASLDDIDEEIVANNYTDCPLLDNNLEDVGENI
jgi:hypothetical protein